MIIKILKEKVKEMLANVGQRDLTCTALATQKSRERESAELLNKGYETALQSVLDVIEAIEIAGANADRLEVPTVFGILYAETSGDPDYPGIYICLNASDEEGIYERTITLVECTPFRSADTVKRTHTLRALVWNDDEAARHHGDYTDDFCILHMEVDEVAKEPFVQTVTLEAYNTVQDTVDAYCLNCERAGCDAEGNDVCKNCPVRKLMDSLKAE